MAGGGYRWQGSFCIEVTPLPCLLTVFGALGDLAGRKLFPALFRLHCRRLLHDNSGIIACGRKDLTADEFRQYIRDLPGMADAPEAEMASFLKRIYYLAGDSLLTIFGILGGSLIEFKDYALYLFAGFVGVSVITAGLGSIFSIGKYLREQGSVVDANT